jgi:hypothetical protein
LKQGRVGRELADASAQTIVHRAAMIDKAMGSGTGFSHPEFARMSNEKIAVATEASLAMIGKLSKFNGILLGFWLRQLQRSATSVVAFAGCRTASAATSIGVNAASAMFADMVSSGIRMARSGQIMADAGIKPIHRVASGNAKRLARVAHQAD